METLKLGDTFKIIIRNDDFHFDNHGSYTLGEVIAIDATIITIELIENLNEKHFNGIVGRSYSKGTRHYIDSLYSNKNEFKLVSVSVFCVIEIIPLIEIKKIFQKNHFVTFKPLLTHNAIITVNNFTKKALQWKEPIALINYLNSFDKIIGFNISNDYFNFQNLFDSFRLDNDLYHLLNEKTIDFHELIQEHLKKKISLEVSFSMLIPIYKILNYEPNIWNWSFFTELLKNQETILNLIINKYEESERNDNHILMMIDGIEEKIKMIPGHFYFSDEEESEISRLIKLIQNKKKIK
jgi:hypothetical protein